MLHNVSAQEDIQSKTVLGKTVLNLATRFAVPSIGLAPVWPALDPARKMFAAELKRANADRIYRVVEHITNGDSEEGHAMVP